MNNLDAAQRIEEIRHEIKALADEAFNLIGDESRLEQERARAYWLGHINQALGGELNDYCGDATISMLDSQKAMTPACCIKCDCDSETVELEEFDGVLWCEDCYDEEHQLTRDNEGT
jgi:hypothetical protein